MPVRADGSLLYWQNYLTKSESCLDEKVIAQLPLEWISELMLTDWMHEGVSSGFDSRILELFPLDKKPIILFGGLSEPAQLRDVISNSNVAAVGVGNFLNYNEHAIQHIKQQMVGAPIRAAQFSAEGYGV
jgi:imidazole glycerol phosphate synthase subunit HisF